MFIYTEFETFDETSSSITCFFRKYFYMKSFINLILLFFTCVILSQEKVLDTIEGKKQNLDEVIVESIRVKHSSPISHSNISKA